MHFSQSGSRIRASLQKLGILKSYGYNEIASSVASFDGCASMNTRRISGTMFAVLLSLTPPVISAAAQDFRATILGRVTDQKNAPVPGVAIEVSNAQTGKVTRNQANLPRHLKAALRICLRGAYDRFLRIRLSKPPRRLEAREHHKNVR